MFIEDSSSPPQNLKTVEEILGMSPDRHRELTWAIEEICGQVETKADAMKKIAQIPATEEERVWMGFILCKYYIAQLPFPVRTYVMQRIG